MKKLYLTFWVILIAKFLSANNAPVLKDDTLAICKNSFINILSPLSNDSDPNGDSIFIAQIIYSPTHGVYSFNASQLIYTPDTNFIGTDKFYIKVCDNGSPAFCNYEFVVLKIDSCLPTIINAPPVAVADTLIACRNSKTELPVLLNDYDTDADSFYIKRLVEGPFNGAGIVDSGKLYYDANIGYLGNDSARYVICDVHGTQSACDTAWVYFTVDYCNGQTNQAPSAQIDIVLGFEDLFTLPFNPLTNDTDPDGDNLTWNPLGIGPFNGTVSQLGNSWIYRPNANFNGIDIMPYRVCDDGVPQKCSFSVVLFYITPANDAPVAKNDSFTTNEDTPVALPVLNNDIDVDNDPLKIKIVSNPTNGTLNLVNNQLTYTPNSDFNGTDNFYYQACDSFKCSQALVKITILPINDAPVAVDDSITFMDGQNSVSILPLVNDNDIDGDKLSISNVSNGLLVNVQMDTSNGQSQLIITRNNNDVCGDDYISYTISDGIANSTALIHVVVPCPMELPTGFSPDGDGKNDLLAFPNAMPFKPLQLKVFNRWGYPVYESEDYQNDWDGKAQDLKQPVPDGSYWYILHTNSGKDFIKYLVIQR